MDVKLCQGGTPKDLYPFRARCYPLDSAMSLSYEIPAWVRSGA